MNTFINALKNNDINELRKVPKSDLHNHITRGGNVRHIKNYEKLNIPKCPKFKNLEEMNMWNAKYIKTNFVGRQGYLERVKLAFRQASEDGVKFLHMSISSSEEILFNDSMEELIKNVKIIHKSTASEINFTPEIAFNTFKDKKHSFNKLKEYLEHDYFRSIDMYGDEKALFEYKDLYALARKNGLITKAHVGEFSDHNIVLEVCKALDLDQIQHGITAANSKETMKYLRDKDVQLNICPTSNILLSRVDDYKSHLIKKLFHNGVKVTINTDDMIIFDQSVSEEYLNLYNSNALSAKELNTIRLTGLRRNNE